MRQLFSELAAAHRVAEMRAPVVGLVHVGHRGGQAALGHHRVRLAEQRFADHAHFRALRQRFDRGPKSRAARADDQHVVFVGFVFGVQRSQQSDVPYRAGWPPDECRNRSGPRRSCSPRPRTCGARSVSSPLAMPCGAALRPRSRKSNRACRRPDGATSGKKTCTSSAERCSPA